MITLGGIIVMTKNLGLSSSKYNKFVDFVRSLDTPIYIVPHVGMCYDAISSGLGLKRVLSDLSIESKLCLKLEYGPAFPQNIALARDISLETMIADPQEIKHSSSVILVDTHIRTKQNGHDYNIKAFPAAFIDHHPLSSDERSLIKRKKIVYYDLRETASCASMICGYIKHSGIHLDKNNGDDVVLATALYAGILVDTNKFTVNKDMSLELKFASMLTRIADLDMINEFANRKYPPEILNIIGSKKDSDILTAGRYRIQIVNLDGLGFELTPQLISAGVDTLTQFGDTSINILLGLSYKDKKVIIKARSSDKAYPVSEELKKLFGDGGGKEESGGLSTSIGKLLKHLDVEKRYRNSRNVQKGIIIALDSMLEKFV